MKGNHQGYYPHQTRDRTAHRRIFFYVLIVTPNAAFAFKKEAMERLHHWTFEVLFINETQDAGGLRK